jgi:hypothetical protein
LDVALPATQKNEMHSLACLCLHAGLLTLRLWENDDRCLEGGDWLFVHSWEPSMHWEQGEGCCDAHVHAAQLQAAAAG